MASENINAQQDEQSQAISRALGRPLNVEASVDLRKRTRQHENVIYVFLLACGLLSILTTVGIVAVLLNESIALFSRPNFTNTNKTLAINVDEALSTIEVSASGARLEDGQTIRLSDEILLINEYQQNYVEVESIGSGAGFERFCEAADIDIANASRPIQADEIAACEANGRTPVEFRVGTDALAVVANQEADFLEDVTLEELQMIFASANRWSDVRPEWPEEPIVRFIPGTDSGTFDYFSEAVYDDTGDNLLSAAPNTSEDDEQLVGGVRRTPLSVGFFGYAYYQENAADLRILSIDGVEPTAETVEANEYPLARPLFIYSDAGIMQEKPEVATFIDYYLTHMNEVITEVGYFPASDAAIADARRNWLAAMGMEADAEATLPEPDIASIGGVIEIAGSSTVYPLTLRIVDIFEEAGYLPRIVVDRAINGSEAATHNAGTEIEVAEQVTLLEFFTNTTWAPPIGEFGVIPLVNATLMTSTIAMLVALPLGLGAAIYLSEYAPQQVRNTLKPILEILAGIPTVVYGYFALTFMTPLLRALFGIETVNIYNTASAGIVVGILIIPLVSSMSEDALSAVPRALREASYGLGATRLETTLQVVLPAALSGVLAAFIVSISRAVGETMVVAIAAGAGPNFTFNPFDSAETMTGHIARISGGDLSYDSIDYNSIFAIGLLLFVITLILNLISRAIINRFRESY